VLAGIGLVSGGSFLLFVVSWAGAARDRHSGR